MALILCPDCGHELSTKAEACTNCGFAFRTTTNPQENIPKWVLIPAITITLISLIVVFALLINNEDETTKNINVNATKPQNNRLNRETTVKNVESNPPSPIIASENQDSQSTTTTPKKELNISPTPLESVKQTDSENGTVKIEAKVFAKNGSVQSVKNEKFYLLDKDLESILDDANLEPIDSNSLVNSFGLSIMYPQRHSQFNQKALAAINKHIKYSTLTDGKGQASIAQVKTDNYYLFGITKSNIGFAVWNSPVNINSGENILNLSPANFNEIDNNTE